jgi:seryl-tRNA synthetase
MLDLKKVRENLDEYKQALAKRHSDCDVDMILAKDDERKSIQQKVDELKFQQKTLASQQDYE